MEKLKVLDIFCGIGGMSKGFIDAGFDIVAAIDDDKQKIKIYEQLFRNSTFLCCNILELNYKELPDFDIIASKLSMQSYSSAGKYKNINTNSYCSITKIIIDKMPKAFLFEILASFPRCNNGNEMKELLEQYKQIGYTLVWETIEAKDFSGLQINDKKTYIVGIRKDISKKIFEFPKPIFSDFNKNNIIEILEENVDEWYRKTNFPKEYETVTGKFYSNVIKEIREPQLLHLGIIDNFICDEKGLRRFTHNEIARLKGLPEFNYNNCNNKKVMYRNIGSSSNAFVIKGIAKKIFEYFQREDFKYTYDNKVSAIIETKEENINFSKTIYKKEEMKQLTIYDSLYIKEPSEKKDVWDLLIEAVDNSNETSQKRGKALETLMVKFFSEIEGFDCKRNIHTINEEMDIVIINKSKIFERESVLIICECKNWKEPIQRSEVNVLLGKMRNRNGRCKLGFLVVWNGISEGFSEELIRMSKTDEVIVVLQKDGIIKAIKERKINNFIYEEYKNTLLI